MSRIESIAVDLAQVWHDAGNERHDSVARLLEAYRPYLLAIANATLHRDMRSKIAASDIVQDTIVSANHKFPAFTGTSEEALRGWLRQILKNQLVDYSRAFQSTGKRDVQREVRLDSNSKIARNADSPVSHVLRMEKRDRIRREIESLPESERDVVKLYHEVGLSFTEVADKLNCSRETVRRTWGRALAMLAASLGDDSCLSVKKN